MNNKIKGLLIGLAALPLAVGCGSDANEQVVSPNATPAPTDDGSRTPLQVVSSTPVDVNAPFETLLSDDEYIPTADWFVPWEDGFLAIGMRPPVQPLPDKLPPEVAELFPPEVTELFPDGLPATQDEAMDILRNAGLLDVIMDILNEHPEAMDAVRSEPTPDTELVAMWSIDGETWTPTEMVAPAGIGWQSQFAVAADRLSFASAVPSLDADGPDSWTVTVASTTDLVNWDRTQFVVPVPEGVPDEDQMSVLPIGVAADDGPLGDPHHGRPDRSGVRDPLRRAATPAVVRRLGG